MTRQLSAALDIASSTIATMTRDFAGLSNQKEESVSIAKMHDGDLKVDLEALYEVLNPRKIGQRPLVILAIAGKCRTGKSFILNFFIRYLRDKGAIILQWQNTNSNWIGGPRKKANDGFLWKGGINPTTQGIDIWKEVFYVKGTDGKEVAVLLMDTQGLFDLNTSSEANAKILSLTTLLSSHVVLNIKDQINEMDLQHLELCIAYARESQKDDNPAKQFQKLTFLIRDWENEREYYYGIEGGTEYLRKILHEKKCSPEVSELKRSVESAFAETSCFLMPYPGKKLKNLDEATNDDLDEEFLQQAIILTEFLLSPSNLLTKTLNGRQATATAICDFCSAIANVFEVGKVPKVVTMLEAQSKIANVDALRAAVRIYGESAKCMCTDDLITEEMITIHHKEWYKTALAVFDEQAFGTHKEQYRDEVAKECDEKLSYLKREIASARKIAEQALKENVLECSKMHRNEMKKLIQHGRTMSDGEIEEQNRALCSKYEQQYLRNAEKSTTALPDDYITKHMASLKISMDLTLMTVKRENNINSQKRLEECSLQEDVANVLKKSMNAYLEKFDEKMKGHENKDYANRQREILNTKLAMHCEHLQRILERRKEIQQQESELMVEGLVRHYQEEVRALLGHGYVQPKAFDDLRDEVLKAGLRQIKGSDEFSKRLLEQLEEKLARATNEFKESNKRNKDFRAMRFENVPASVTDILLKKVEFSAGQVAVLVSAAVITSPIIIAGAVVVGVGAAFVAAGRGIWNGFKSLFS